MEVVLKSIFAKFLIRNHIKVEWKCLKITMVHIYLKESSPKEY